MDTNVVQYCRANMEDRLTGRKSDSERMPITGGNSVAVLAKAM